LEIAANWAWDEKKKRTRKRCKVGMILRVNLNFNGLKQKRKKNWMMDVGLQMNESMNESMNE
jgi:hypothetical protein